MKKDTTLSSRRKAFDLWAPWVRKHSGMPFFGTLLGLQRDGDLLQWDDDVDFLLPVEKREELKQRISSMSARISVENDWLIQISCQILGGTVLVDFYFFTVAQGFHVVPWGLDGTPWHNSSHLYLDESRICWAKEDWTTGGVKSAGLLLELLYGVNWGRPQRRYVDYEAHVLRNNVVIRYPGPVRRCLRQLEISLRSREKPATITFAYLLGVLSSYPVFFFMRLVRFSRNFKVENGLTRSS